MRPQRVLFIGGSGIISSACVTLAVERGIDLTVLNRGAARDPAAARRGQGAARRHPRRRSRPARRSATATFDAVVDCLAFTPDHVQRRPRPVRAAAPASTSSSARPRPTRPRRPGCPSTESTPLRNPYWQYSRDKIACEDLLVAAYRERRLPGRRSCGRRTPTTAPRSRSTAAGPRIGPDAPGQAGRRARRRHLAVDADPPRRTSPAASSRCWATRARSATPSTSPPTTC